MNQKLADKLSTLPDSLSKATSAEDIAATVADVERQVLKTNFEEYQAGGRPDYVAYDYQVGERNSRGLSWKLGLLRTVAAANFSQLMRVGVHGGNTRILGQQDNIDATLVIYDALVESFGAVSKASFTNVSDGESKEDGATTVHKAGWINNFLLEAPEALGEALNASREKDLASNPKAANMVAAKDEALAAFKTSIAPPPAPKAPKTPKSAPSDEGTESAEGENTGESAAPSDTPEAE